MEVISNGSFNLKRQWRRRKYRRIDSALESRKNIKIVRFGGKVKRRVWKLRGLRKLRFKFSSPLKLWLKLKNAYMNMMLNLSSSVSALNTTGNVGFGTKRIPKARNAPLAYNKTEFENRLVYEIYKSLVVSMELNTR